MSVVKTSTAEVITDYQNREETIKTITIGQAFQTTTKKQKKSGEIIKAVAMFSILVGRKLMKTNKHPQRMLNQGLQ